MPLWKEGRRLSSRGELWEYTGVLWRDLGKWVYSVWAQASMMRTCFYEGWCTREYVESALEEIEKLVIAVGEKVKASAK